MSNNNHKPLCRNCDEEYATARWRLGYKHCMPCGEKLSHEKSYALVAPMHKSNYMLITDTNDLKGINNKGGLHR
jgi:ribosomal protein L37AE/L43A